MTETDDKTFNDLRLRAAICPGAEVEWDKPGTTHWIALHQGKTELRDAVSSALASMDAIDQDKDFSPDGKRHKKQELAEGTLEQLGQSERLEKARDRVAKQLAKWNEKFAEIVKPAQTEAEAVLHGEIRRHVACLKDEAARMAFIEKNGADPRVASALLEAPAFLSGIGNTEIASVRSKVEQQCLSPEVVAAKGKVAKAMAELERAFRVVPSLLSQRAGLPNAPAPKPNFKTIPATKQKRTEPRNAAAPVWAET